MKTHITAGDIADTLLHEDTLRELYKAGRFSEDKNREGCIDPFIRTRLWKPGCQEFYRGGFNQGFNYGSSENSNIDDALRYISIHFHPRDSVLIPSGADADLNILLRNKWGIYEGGKGRSGAEDYEVRFRKICGVANYSPEQGVGVLLFQLKNLHKSKGGSYPQRLILEQLDEDLGRLHFPSQEEVVETMNQHVNAVHLRLPLDGLKNKEKRRKLREDMQHGLEHMLEPFATDVVVTRYEGFSMNPEWLKESEKRKASYGLKQRTS